MMSRSSTFQVTKLIGLKFTATRFTYHVIWLQLKIHLASLGAMLHIDQWISHVHTAIILNSGPGIIFLGPRKKAGAVHAYIHWTIELY